MILSFFKHILPDRIISQIRNIIQLWRTKSIHAAVREQGLLPLRDHLCEIVPDISEQYSSHDLGSNYQIGKVRAQHAFQIWLVNKAIQLIEDSKDLRIVDIGDSSGTHVQYLLALHKDVRSLSVNIDPQAVKKIREKGLEAIHARAEDVQSYSSTDVDISMSFEMLEHLMNPTQFLKDLAGNINCKFFVITVPYLSKSRVGLHHIRHSQQRNVTAEGVHIFEFSPPDWRLLFMHSGWSIVHERVYLQYPRRGFWRLMKWHWRRHDFEGFWGAILKRDSTWSKLYSGW